VTARLVNDGCYDKPQPPIESRKQAEGILDIHESCDPPCPRRIAAQQWLTGGKR
jgi:hypothetical protein